MQIETMQELYVDVLKDLYDAEQQILKALPKMAKAANSEELRDGFQEHLAQTQTHLERLDQVFDGDHAAVSSCLPPYFCISEKIAIRKIRNMLDSRDWLSELIPTLGSCK